MYKNWQTISKEPDLAFRFLLTTTTDERILAGLQRGFPEFFSPKEQALRVPLSTIRAWREKGEDQKENWRLPLPETVLDNFGIPYFMFGDSSGIGYPKEWKKSLKKKDISINSPQYKKLLYLDWQGKRCLVADHTHEGEVIILVPEEFIDVDA